MGCRVLQDLTLECGDNLYPAGAAGLLWVGYASDLSTPFDLSQAADIQTILFSAYRGLRKLEGVKYAHIFASEGQVGAGGNISIIHRATMKFITRSTQDDRVVQQLMQATDAFIIYQNSAREFFILGPSGMRYAAGPIQTTGQNPGDDNSDNVILEGTEIVKPLRFRPTGVTDIAAYLNARLA